MGDVWAEHLTVEARWFATLLGAVRDAEVLRDRLRAGADALPDADRRVGGALARRLEDTRERARDALLTARREPRFVAFASLLVESARAAAELQDVLGEHQDAVIAQEWLRRAASEATRRQAFVAGQLYADEARAAARARRRCRRRGGGSRVRPDGYGCADRT